MTNQQTLRK